MRIVIASCHLDIEQTRRLTLWIDFLGVPDADFLFTFSRKAWSTGSAQGIVEYVSKWPRAECLRLPDEDETGWPRSATHMFDRSLKLADDDVFWLEPDCVPTKPGWWEAIHGEYLAAGSPPFMGRVVNEYLTTPKHMTGVAFYRKDCRDFTGNFWPIRKGEVGAWDVDRCKEILPVMVETKSIQHVWRRFGYNSQFISDWVSPRTWVFHQCKTGEIMRALRPDFDDWVLTSTQSSGHPYHMAKYFLVKNTRVPVKVGGREFSFDPVVFVPASGSWLGTFEAESVDDQLVLADAASRGLVKAISKDEYDQLQVKKKNGSANLPKTSVSFINNNLTLNSGRLAGPVPTGRQSLVQNPKPVPVTPSADSSVDNAEGPEAKAGTLEEATTPAVLPKRGRGRPRNE
jgi:hypothetical protein